MIDIEEKKIIRKAAAGSAEAFEALVLQYQTPIYNLCLRITGNPEDAADMTQESFLKAWRSLDSFHFEAAFSTWLYRLASNTCLDFLRSTKRRRALSLTVEDESGESQLLDLPDPAPTPEAALLTNEENALLSAAMGQLDPEQRRILTLRVVNDLSYTEIAAVLNIKEGTVKSRLARARENLRKKLLQSGNKTESNPSKQQKRKGGRGGEL
ncbi:MAG: RNA polymerase sigma factor [Faecousia sp.]